MGYDMWYIISPNMWYVASHGINQHTNHVLVLCELGASLIAATSPILGQWDTFTHSQGGAPQTLYLFVYTAHEYYRYITYKP